MNLRPYSAMILIVEGVVLFTVGVYFIFIRPPLLSEDLKYIGTTQSSVRDNIPGLSRWLEKVFLVMGGYISATGLFTVYVAQTNYRQRIPGALFVVLIAGITSIGLMVAVNFILQSDFKWILFGCMSLWISSLILYLFHK